MSGLKEELSKLKLSPASNESGTDKIAADNTSGSALDEMDWKKGVEPIKLPSDKITINPPRRDNILLPQKDEPITDHLPSAAVTQTTYYGTVKTGPNQTIQSLSATLELPGFQELGQVIMANPGEFKKPDPWVKAGISLRAPGSGNGPALQVRMGIDFGTAYTKVALRAANHVFFVDWDGVRNSKHSYFLPGEISCCDGDKTCLGRPREASLTYGALKTPILSPGVVTATNCNATTAFLAWVMRYARAWLYRHQTSLVRNRRLAWEVNLGCPTAHWCSTTTTQHIKHIASCAWKISQFSGDIDLAMARSQVSNANFAPGAVGMDGLFIVPEFVAQIAGYLNSPQGKKDGLHLLVDVGAGTLDIAAFNVFHQDKGNTSEVRLPIFAGTVKPLGTHVLMATRLREAKVGVLKWDDLDGLPCREQISRDFGIEADILARIDEQFTALILKSIYNVMDYTKTKRDWSAQEWKKGMRIFLTGGGAACDIYRQGVEKCFHQFKTPPLFTSFPMLDAAANKLGAHHFHRVSVAFGLTYDAESIGKIIPPKDIDDLPPPEIATRPDRDDLYPK